MLRRYGAAIDGKAGNLRQLVECIEKLDQIEKSRSRLPARDRDRWQAPNTIMVHFRAALPKAAAKAPSPNYFPLE